MKHAPFILKVLTYLTIGAGVMPLFYKKGGNKHRLWGRWHYYGAVSLLFFSILYNSVERFNWLLAVLSFSSFYFAFTGKNIVAHKLRGKGFKNPPILKIIAFLGITLCLILWGILLRIFPLLSSLHLILGNSVLIILLIFCFQDIKAYFSTKISHNYKKDWLFLHINRTILTLLTLLAVPFSFSFSLPEAIFVICGGVLILGGWLYFIKVYNGLYFIFYSEGKSKERS
jgi:hypothetical protein